MSEHEIEDRLNEAAAALRSADPAHGLLAEAEELMADFGHMTGAAALDLLDRLYRAEDAAVFAAQTSQAPAPVVEAAVEAPAAAPAPAPAVEAPAGTPIAEVPTGYVPPNPLDLDPMFDPLFPRPTDPVVEADPEAQL